MLIDTEKYLLSLKKLWSDVFGDSEEYISLIFDKGYTPAECFGEIIDGKVVSALYLLKCKIEADGNNFSGRYLYAAATLKEYRKNGIMGKLINEAKEYACENNIDFIALVPASDKLYEYYEKFGFETVMHKYSSEVLSDGTNAVEDEVINDAESFLKMRKLFNGDRFIFESPEMKYALSCLNYAGYFVYKNTEDSYYIADKDKNEVIEYISSHENFIENTKTFCSKLKKGTMISSPYDLSEFCESSRQRFGMVFTDCHKLSNSYGSGIYMNIALD